MSERSESNQPLLTAPVNTPLLFYNSLSSWTKRTAKLTKSFFCSNVIFLLLYWEFSTSLIYNLIFDPYLYYVQVVIGHILFPAVITFIFLFSPLTGFLADVKFTRFKVLECSTYVMLISGVTAALVEIVLVSTVHDTNYYSILIFTPLYLALIVYSCSRMSFVANILQFAMDQLRDQPTTNSVLFLYLYFFCFNLSSLVAVSTNIPGHVFVVDFDKVAFDTLKFAVVISMIVFSIASMTIVLFVIHKKKSWLVTEKIARNPYKLVYEVLHFAWLNKKPIRHPSAFIYCEDERPSRMDFGKRKYGGPFTTEQVEDVKVMLHILKVLFSLGPTFQLHVGVLASILNRHSHITHYEVNNPVQIMFFDNGLMSPLLTVICIPIYLLVVKPFFSRWLPNLFKRMGLSIAVVCLSYVLLLISDTFAYDSNTKINHLHSVCKATGENSSYVLNWDLITFPSTYMFTLQYTLSSLHQMLLYISSWELISSQSPQHLKGILFGLFYAIKAFYEFLAAIILIPFAGNWASGIMSCLSAFLLLNLGIGVMTLLIYTVVAKKYKYRKRDDICNYYQFAENYYSSSR